MDCSYGFPQLAHALAKFFSDRNQVIDSFVQSVFLFRCERGVISHIEMNLIGLSNNFLF